MTAVKKRALKSAIAISSLFALAVLGLTPANAALTPSGAVPAKAETQTFSSGSGDIADDPAIWVNPTDPAKSVVVGSKKSASGGGLAVFNLDGTIHQFLSVGELNNVDIRTVNGKVLLVASNRTDNTLTYFYLDPATRNLTKVGSTAVGFEPYGVALYVSPVNGDVYAFVTQTTSSTGQFDQYRLSLGTSVSGSKVRDLSTSTQSEGMVADDASSTLFLGEEDKGLYKYNAEPNGGSTRTTIDTVSGHLTADVEGLAIVRNPDGNYIVASSQGANSFQVYDLAAPHTWRKQFTVAASGSVDAVTGTDGLDVTRKNLGPLYPEGLLVVHDTSNSGGSMSNFKFVDASKPFGTLGGTTPTPDPEPTPTPTGPTVSMKAPVNNATVKGTAVLLDVTQSGASKIEYFLGTTKIGEDLTSPAFDETWDSTTVNDGTYQLTAKATGSSGSTTSAPVTINVDNVTDPAPEPEPTDAPPVSGNWTATFSDEFDGTSLDTTKWATNWYSDGAAYNGAGTFSHNVELGNGTVSLALESTNAGAAIHTDVSGGYKLPVGSYAEARIWLPGPDTSNIYNWPSWSTTSTSAEGAPSAGEHDIVDAVVVNGQTKVGVNYHSPSGTHDQGVVSGNWAKGWHTFGIHRKANSADIYYDDVLVKSYATDDNGNSESLVLSHGVKDPQRVALGEMMRVDYVRTWKPDTTQPAPSLPTVGLTSPTNNATVKGSVTLNVTQTGADKIEYFLGSNKIAEDLSGPAFDQAWNSATIADGSYQLTAKATNAAGSKTSSAITVVVDNVTEPTPEPSGGLSLIKYGQDTPSVSQVRANPASITNLPFQGWVLDGETWATDLFSSTAYTTPSTDFDLPDMKHVTDNFYRAGVFTQDQWSWTNDAFWNTTQANMTKFAQAMKAKVDAGEPWKGVVIDPEWYGNGNPFNYGTGQNNWTYSATAGATPGLQPAEAKALVERRGKQVMDGLRAGWPEIDVFVTYGTWLSDPDTFTELPANGVPINDFMWANELGGHFINGFYNGAYGSTGVEILDGAEVYSPRTQAQFDTLADWVNSGTANSGNVVPAARATEYKALTKAMPPVYDLDESNNYALHSASSIQSMVTKALNAGEDYAWLYTEEHEWSGISQSGKPAVPAAYVDAVEAGIASADGGTTTPPPDPEPEPAAPAAPTGVTSKKNSNNSITISASPVSGATSYVVRETAYDQTDPGNWVVSTPTRTSGTLAAGHWYQYSMAARNAVGTSSFVVTDPICVGTCTTPAPGTDPEPTPDPDPEPTPDPDPEPTPTPGAFPGFDKVGNIRYASTGTLGSQTITANNTVIERKTINGTITIDGAQNVTLRDITVNGGSSGYGIRLMNGARVNIEYATVKGFDNGIAFSGWRCFRCDISGQEQDGVKLGDDTTLEQSYIHDLKPEAGAHADGGQMQSAAENLVIKDNWIDSRGGGSFGNSALIIKNDSKNTLSGPGPVTIDNNFLDGGNYTIYVYKGSSGGTVDNIRVTNNKFGGHYRYGYSAVNIPIAVKSNNTAADGSLIGNLN
jgi:myo-inositol-hexaphosphate 3-phosphohydrolase